MNIKEILNEQDCKDCFDIEAFKKKPVAYLNARKFVLGDEELKDVVIAMGQMVRDGYDKKKLTDIMNLLAEKNPKLAEDISKIKAKKRDVREEAEEDIKNQEVVKKDPFYKKTLATLCVLLTLNGLSPYPVSNEKLNVKAFQNQPAIITTVNEEEGCRRPRGLRFDGNDVYLGRDLIAFMTPETMVIKFIKECPQEVKDFFLCKGWIVKNRV